MSNTFFQGGEKFIQGGASTPQLRAWGRIKKLFKNGS